MGFSAASLQAFAKKSALHRASAFAGRTASDGANVLIGTRRLTLAFVRYDQTREIVEQGYRYATEGTVLLPDCLTITVILGGELTYLPTSEVYRIDGIVEHPASAEKKLVLRRVNG